MMTDEEFMAAGRPAAQAAPRGRVMSDEEFAAAAGPAPAAGPEQTWGQWAAGVPGRVVHDMGRAVRDTVAGAPAEGERMITEFSELLTEDIPRIAAAFGRTVGHNLLPSLVGQETPEQGRTFDRAMTDVSFALAGGAAGRAVGSHLSEALKYLGRGFKTRPGAQRFIAGEAPKMLGAPVREVGAGDLVSPTLTGMGIGMAVDATDPSRVTGTHSEFIDNPVAAAAGTVAAAGVAKNTVEDMLLTNPRWKNMVMRGSPAPVSTAIGATLGFLVSKGIQLGADTVDEVIKFVIEDDEAPGPQAGATDVTGPLPPRSPPPQSDNLDQQRQMARRLLA